MEEDPKSNQQVRVPLNKRYNYVVGIDFGTYSTSFSFVHVDYENDIQTIKHWETIENNSFPGRVASSIIYKEEDSIPLWGISADKRFYNEKDDFFYTPHIKLYLTDAENQTNLPGKLTPVKLVSDYLKQLHEYGVNQMKIYFQKKNEENKVESEIESTGIAVHGISLSEENSKPTFNFTEDQIRYTFSYPDNQVDGVYKMQVREALEMAGIISSEDPDRRLTFITESEATARFCLNQSSLQLKPSPKPYLVCYIGGEAIGFSTIQAEEISETATAISHADQAVAGCGKLEIDKNMRKYLADKLTASPEYDTILSRVRQELFDFYIDEIKTSFTEESNGTGDYYHNMVGVSNSIIKSALLDGETFVFSYNDLKSDIFDPVTNKILENIENAIKELDMGVSGIFLSGAIGERRYLNRLVTNRFGTANIKVVSIENSVVAVSEGLIYPGIRERGLMIPYFEGREVRQKQRVLTPGNKNRAPISTDFGGAQKLNHEDIDYIIGLDFGTTYSGFAYAPVPESEEEEKKSHTLVIKEIKAWPKQTGGNYPKAPTVLYYNQRMEYMNKFGHEARNESAKSKANGVLLRHFKLLLSREFNPMVDDKILKKLDDFDVTDAIANYLRDFNKEGIARMKRKGIAVDENRLFYVVTVPEMWSDEAKNTMKAAIRKAGILKSKNNDRDLDERIVFITEALAAALYCEKYYKDEFDMDRRQQFMICDAGGGTVDVTTFEVSQEESADGKNNLVELTSGDSDSCGSVYLDENFRNYILDKFNENSIRYTEKGIENLLEQFIREIKPNFESSLDPDMEDDIRLNVPMSFGLPSYFEDETGFIQDDEIVIPYSDMENKVFKPVVDQVLDLIDKQLRKLPEGERQLDAILVVGGFGQSPYLHYKLRERFENKAVGAIFIGKPPYGDLAVSRGAVSFGLEPRMISEGVTRQTYCLQVKDLCRENDDLQQRVIGYDKRIYCQNALSEIVAKETKISKGVVYIMKTFVIYPKKPVFAIYAINALENDNDLRTIINTGNIQPICKLTAKMPEILNIKKGDKVEFEVVVEIAGTNINVDILCQGKLLTENVMTRANIVVSKKKYELGSRAEKKKERWRIPIYSLSS